MSNIKGTIVNVKDFTGRIYTGIDNLNSAALRWLDNEGNGTTNIRTRKPPRELFREEIRHLEKFYVAQADTSMVRSVSDKFMVKVDWSNYELPHNVVRPYDQVRIENEFGILLFYKAGSNELIYKCKKRETAGVSPTGRETENHIPGRPAALLSGGQFLKRRTKYYLYYQS